MKRVWYHGNCYDGFTAAWVASLKLGRGEDVEYVPCGYGKPAPEFNDGDEIYIVDFSFPREELLKIKERAGSLLVLDHHKTAQDDLKGLDFCTFDMERSGAGLTWDYFNPGKPRPNIVTWVEDRDLWKFRYEETKPFQAYLRSQSFDFEVWDSVCARTRESFGLEATIEAGAAILQFQDSQVEKMCYHSWITEIKGHKVAVICATAFWSEVGHHLLEKHPEAEFSASFGRASNGDVIWSLRSEGDFNVADIAKQYGGGGHSNAAGMKTKTISEVFTKWKEDK